MKRFINIISSTLIAVFAVTGLAFAGSVATVDTVVASNHTKDVKDGITGIGGNTEGRKADALTNIIERIINILLFIIGVIAVIMIIVGGIRYTTSNGDSAQLTSAKNTILYSIVGVVVAIMAYAIVNWIVEAL